MIYILYAIYSIINLPMTLLALLLSPILPLFASDITGKINNGSRIGVGPRLPSWLNWFMTPDNSLYGDDSFIAVNSQSYLSQIKWLIRNPAYGLALYYIDGTSIATFSGDKTIKDNDNAKAGWCFVKAGGLFQFTWVQPIGFSRCLYVNFGWNIRALVDDNVNPKPNPYEATFVCSPRLSGFR